MATAILDKLLPRESLPVYVGGMLLANILIAWGTLQLLRSRALIERKRVAEPKPEATPPAKPKIAAPQPPSGATQ
jgi:hypothetical protein